MILSTICEPIGFVPILANFAVLNPPRPPLPDKSQPDEPKPDEPSDEDADSDVADNDFADDLDEMPMTDDADWEVFIPDELERDPLPEPGDFWPAPDSPWN